MFDPSIIFQRTEAGRDEIRQKSRGLTQSERLVLIMVDGASTYQQVRAKLSALTDERFNRAISSLQKKELVLEVFLPLEGQVAEELESTVIDRFLHQDPLDPVTIILRDPDDELGLLGKGVATRAQSPGHTAADAADEAIPTLTAVAPEMVMDAIHLQLVEDLGRELQARQQAHPARIVPLATLPMFNPVANQPVVEERPRSLPHWGYWLIAVGLAFIAGYFLARLA
jgi:hypothetical protein